MLADLEIKLYLEVVCLRMLLGGSTSWHTVGQGRRREGEVAGKVGRTTVVDPSEPWDFRLIEKRKWELGGESQITRRLYTTRLA